VFFSFARDLVWNLLLWACFRCFVGISRSSKY